MHKFTLTPTQIMAAYLAGYLAIPGGDVFDCHIFDDDGPPPGDLERLAAYALGERDRNRCDPASVNAVLDSMRIMLAGLEAQPAAPSPSEKPDTSPPITFTWAGVRYRAPGAFARVGYVQLPDKTVLRANGWLESMPPQPQGLHVVRVDRRVDRPARVDIPIAVIVD